MLAQEGMGERIVHRAWNALTDDLGDEEYDLIFIGNLPTRGRIAISSDAVRKPCARAITW